jgi:tRNA (guanine-N7-)-methyltransferase
MSTDLGRGRPLDDAPGVIGVSQQELPTLPDAIMHDPWAGLLDPRQWFAHPSRPFEVEIGCGKGTFILNQAASDPETNYLGIEWAREYELYTADRVRRAGLKNVRMLHTDATDFLRWRMPSNIVRVIHLYFSDPWPKTKHHKNRVVQDSFLQQIWRVLVPGGELRIVTDHDELWAWDMQHFTRWTTPGASPSLLGLVGPLHVVSATPGQVTQPLPPDVAPFSMHSFTPPEWTEDGQAVGTNYERKKCLEEGKQPHACVLKKQTAPAQRS